MINVFFIVHDFSGARTYVNELSRYLVGEGNISVFHIFLNRTDFKEFYVQTNFRITNIYIPKKVDKEYNKLYYRRAAQLILCYFHALRSVVVHANMPEQFYFADEIVKLFQCPLVFTLHFLLKFYSFYDKIADFVCDNNDIGNVLEKKMLDSAAHIICVTRFGKRVIVDHHGINPSKTTVIYNGISLSSGSSEDRLGMKTLYGFLPEDRLILFVGRLEFGKGLDLLIKAFLLIKEQFPASKLVIAGQGEYDFYFPLTIKCPGRIIFTGNLDQNTLHDFYQISEMGVIPSRNDQCSYVAIEMMQNNLPIIISDVSGLNELIMHQKTGLVCRTKPVDKMSNEIEVDEADLAGQMKYLLLNTTIAMEYAENAYTQARKIHSQKSMGDNTLKVYKKLLIG